MPRVTPSDLSRREAQILEILYRRGQATVADVRAELPDAPSYTAVRKLLEILERRRHVVHTTDGRRYVYTPAQPIGQARTTALRRLLDTFFAGSAEHAMAALLTLSGRRPTEARLREILKLAAKSEGEAT
jgi:BlaI family penicillinase repressor